jgi:hypothetical protein
MSWKDCSNRTKCSGTYSGSVTWTPPPAVLVPGSNIRFSVTSQTSAHNTCGERNIGSYINLRGNGLLASADDRRPAGNTVWLVPRASPGQKMDIQVIIQVANLTGSVKYVYVFER